MKQPILNISGQGQRVQLVVAIQSYAQIGYLMGWFFKRITRSMRLKRADFMILGWHNRRPSPGLVKRAQAIKAKGLCRYLAMSGHQRNLFPLMAAEGQRRAALPALGFGPLAEDAMQRIRRIGDYVRSTTRKF